MLTWIKFGSFVLFGMWGLFSGNQLRRRDKGSLLRRFFFRLEDFIVLFSCVVLISALGFNLGSISPVGVSFLTVPALAYLVGGLVSYIVTDIHKAETL